MKRTWVVYVGPGIGHELNNTISDAEWYGPYTKAEAEKLEADLNSLFSACAVRDCEGSECERGHEGEGNKAEAMPLECSSPRKVLAKFWDASGIQ
jgi:hypothetical protein